MANEPAPQPTALGILGIMVACFFGIMCFYHVVFWGWQAAAFHSDKKQAWTHIIIWLVLGTGSALVWCRLVWLLYFPKKPKL
jgi:hypothetical protein